VKTKKIRGSGTSLFSLSSCTGCEGYRYVVFFYLQICLSLFIFSSSSKVINVVIATNKKGNGWRWVCWLVAGEGVDPRWKKKSLFMVRFGLRWVDPQWWDAFLLLVVDFEFNGFLREGCCR
jgi:hypothetical protein